MSTVLSVLSGIVAFIKAVPVIDGWFQQLIALYVTSQTSATLSRISDAASLAARAQSDEDRYKAAKAWIDALSRPRIN